MSKKFSRRHAMVLGGGVALGSLGITASAQAMSSETDWIRLPVITANIGRKNLGQRNRAIRDVRNGDGDNLPVVGWQEIGEGDSGEKGMIAKHFGDRYQVPFLHNDKSYRVPMTVPTEWEITSRKKTWVHGGISGTTPPRWINEVVVEHTGHPDLGFALVNTHYVANAFNGNLNPDLQELWKEHKKLHKQRVLAHHEEGRLVIWTADVNRPDYGTATGNDGEKQVFAKGIDRINWLPADNNVQIQLRDKYDIPMDVDGHNARVAIFRIRLT